MTFRFTKKLWQVWVKLQLKFQNLVLAEDFSCNTFHPKLQSFKKQKMAQNEQSNFSFSSWLSLLFSACHRKQFFNDLVQYFERFSRIQKILDGVKSSLVTTMWIRTQWLGVATGGILERELDPVWLLIHIGQLWIRPSLEMHCMKSSSRIQTCPARCLALNGTSPFRVPLGKWKPPAKANSICGLHYKNEIIDQSGSFEPQPNWASPLAALV